MATTSRKSDARRYWSARVLVCLVAAVAISACARVETIDQFGNKKVGWFMASSSKFVDSDKAKVVTVNGFGFHRVGPFWALGKQRARYLMLDRDCRLVVFKEPNHKVGLEGSLGSDLRDICAGQRSDSDWSTRVQRHGGQQ